MSAPARGPDDHLISRMDGIRRILMAHYFANRSMPSPIQGADREILIREYLSKVFPSPYRFGGGIIVDAVAASSSEMDIVVEFPFFPSLPTPAGEKRLYVAESVAFVIEVKSDLSKSWSSIARAVTRLGTIKRLWKSMLIMKRDGTFEYVSGEKKEDGSKSIISSRIPYVVVAYRGYKRMDTLRAKIEELAVDSRPDGVLVIESGLYLGVASGLRATEAAALFGFWSDTSHFATNVISVAPHFEPYFA